MPGKGQPFTAAEDAIILVGKSAGETNRLLAESGYPLRTPNSIKARRYELRRAGRETRTTGSDNVQLLAARRSTLNAQIEELRVRLRELETEAAEVGRLLLKAVTDEVADDTQSVKTS